MSRLVNSLPHYTLLSYLRQVIWFLSISVFLRFIIRNCSAYLVTIKCAYICRSVFLLWKLFQNTSYHYYKFHDIIMISCAVLSENLFSPSPQARSTLPQSHTIASLQISLCPELAHGLFYNTALNKCTSGQFKAADKYKEWYYKQLSSRHQI